MITYKVTFVKRAFDNRGRKEKDEKIGVIYVDEHPSDEMAIMSKAFRHASPGMVNANVVRLEAVHSVRPAESNRLDGVSKKFMRAETIAAAELAGVQLL